MKDAGRNQKTRFALLGMLTLQPMSGYDIRKNVDASIAHFWNESYGQIYPMLKRLEREGLVTRKTDRNTPRNRQVYAITAKGRAALGRWLAEPAGRELVRNELLLKLFFARNASLAEPLRHLEEFRAAQAAELRQFRAMERDLPRDHANHPDLPYWLITLRFGIRQSEASVRWADEALVELNRSAGKRSRKSGAA